MDDMGPIICNIMLLSITLLLKEEIEHLLQTKCIQVTWYVEWVSNVVPVKKKTNKIKIFCNYHDLNIATPKYEYVMPLNDQLVDAVAMNVITSFTDNNARYHQIFISEEDLHKITF